MPKLDLSNYQPQVKKIDGELYIFDLVRKKYVYLIPEEWVRQALIDLLVHQYHYPKGLMRIEGGLNYGQRQKRSDILVYDRFGHPFFLVECKSMKVPINQSVIDQAAQYNAVIQAPYLAVCNGVDYYAYQMDHQAKKIEPIAAIPSFPEK